MHTQRTQAARTAPRPRLHCVVSWRAVCHVIGIGGSCRRPPLDRIVVVPQVPLRAVPHVSQPFPRPCRACIATQPSGQAARLSGYTHLYCDPISQQSGPRTRSTRPCEWVGRVVASFWSCRGRAVALSWPATPCRGLAPCAQASLLCYPVSWYKNCIVTQTRKRGSSTFVFFFFTTLFFFSFQLLENLPKNIFIFFFIFQ